MQYYGKEIDFNIAVVCGILRHLSIFLQVQESQCDRRGNTERYNLSVTKVQRIFDKHVDIKRKPLPEVLSIDEHYFPESSYDSLYICIFMDFNTGTIIDVLPDRKKNYLANYLSTIRRESFDSVKNTSELSNNNSNLL